MTMLLKDLFICITYSRYGNEVIDKGNLLPKTLHMTIFPLKLERSNIIKPLTWAQ